MRVSNRENQHAIFPSRIKGFVVILFGVIVFCVVVEVANNLQSMASANAMWVFVNQKVKIFITDRCFHYFVSYLLFQLWLFKQNTIIVHVTKAADSRPWMMETLKVTVWKASRKILRTAGLTQLWIFNIQRLLKWALIN